MRSGKSMILASIAGSHRDGRNYDVYCAHRDNYARKEGNHQLSSDTLKHVDADGARYAKAPDLEAHSAYIPFTL
jgi:hypothetical protein